MSVASEHILRRMWQRGGVIKQVRGADILPIHPRGDARTRHIGWIEAVDARTQLGADILCETDRGLELSETTRLKMDAGVSAHDILLSVKPVHRKSSAPTRRLSTIDLLARQVDTRRRPVLTPPQLAAARRFARDLFRAGEGSIAASDPSAPKVDGTRSHDRVERAAIIRLDAASGLRKARAVLDPNLSRVACQVLGAGRTPKQIDGAEDWAAGTALTLLRFALDGLVGHYGTVAGESGRASQGG